MTERVRATALGPAPWRPVERPSPAAGGTARVEAMGKFFQRGSERLDLRGVTYGTFRPDRHGCDFPAEEVVDADFAQMAANGANSVRVYTVPPRWLLDTALRHGLLVLVGLPWEQHVTFLEGRRRRKAIVASVREGVRACAGHPAVLGYVVGNEIPASIVRWYGARRVERFIARLYRAVKQEDPEALCTYVNYPTTEYLQLPFLDFVSFNVYLERQPDFDAYLARLQNLAGDRPLVMAEVGLDSRRHGEPGQAVVLGWQLRSIVAAGCAGAFVFAWTDEWHRGGHDVDDWDFGLVDRGRQPKEALEVVRRAYAARPFPSGGVAWPRMSVVVCTYNGAKWLPECLSALERVDYPDYEVIVVNDGSADDSGRIAEEHGWVKALHTENRGLSAARNTGLEAATGEIVAYLDDDARPDPQWLTQLALAFVSSDHAGIGGPNLPPPGDGFVADCVASAPGGPVHVLVTDVEAEHIPGCNMAFRKARLEEIGGFDTRFRAAGDDVDICWRLQECGETIGFSYGALVWHHRRNSVRGYLKQQVAYGFAEALLERKWPGRFNRAGHVTWSGHVYGARTRGAARGRRARVHYGTWGTRLFQSVYGPAPGAFGSLPLMPEWFLALALLAMLSPLALVWPPMLAAAGLLALGTAVTAVRAVVEARHRLAGAGRTRGPSRVPMSIVTTALHVLQPLSRTSGRLRGGLGPWRRRCGPARTLPRGREIAIWSEDWIALHERLAEIEAALRTRCGSVTRGADYDRWDLRLRGGPLGIVRLLATVEEHGAGRQLFRFKLWPRASRGAVAVIAVAAAMSAGAAIAAAWPAVLAGLGIAAATALHSLYDCACALTVATNVLQAGTAPAGARADAVRVPVDSSSTPQEMVREAVLAGGEDRRAVH